MAALRVALTGKKTSASTQRIEKAFARIITASGLKAEMISGQRSNDFPPGYLSSIDCLLVSVFDGKVHLKELLPECTQLRWVHSLAAGVDMLVPDLRDVKPNVPFTNARTAFSGSLAEYALSMMLHFIKQVPKLQEHQRGKRWDPFVMDELRGKTVGFVGFGSIAQRTAGLLLPWNIDALVHRRRASTNCSEFVLETGEIIRGREVDKQTVFAESDIVICSLPHTEETTHYCDADSFGRMKTGAIFISIGRGKCVDEEALVRALPKLRGCALDVFNVEPLPVESPLWEASNLIISSHNADMIESYYEDSMQVWAERLEEYLAGKPFSTLVDMKAGY